MERRIISAFLHLALCACVFGTARLRCLCEAPYNLAPECFRPECSGDNIVCATNRQFLEQIRQVVFISHCLHSSVNSNVTVLCSRSTTRCCSTDLCNRAFHNNDSAFDITSTPATSPVLNSTSSMAFTVDTSEQTTVSGHESSFSDLNSTMTTIYTMSSSDNKQFQYSVLYSNTALIIYGVSFLLIVVMCSCIFITGFFCGVKYNTHKKLNREESNMRTKKKVGPNYEDMELAETDTGVVIIGYEDVKLQ